MKTGKDSGGAAGGADGEGHAGVEGGDENKLIAERRAKLAALRAGGGGGGGPGGPPSGGAFPNDFRRDALAE